MSIRLPTLSVSYAFTSAGTLTVRFSPSAFCRPTVRLLRSIPVTMTVSDVVRSAAGPERAALPSSARAAAGASSPVNSPAASPMITLLP